MDPAVLSTSASKRSTFRPAADFACDKCGGSVRVLSDGRGAVAWCHHCWTVKVLDSAAPPRA